MTVIDDGVGLPLDFSLDSVTGLGLSIVRTLVTTELMGTIALERGTADGDRPGTVVRLDVPGGRAGVSASDARSRRTRTDLLPEQEVG